MATQDRNPDKLDISFILSPNDPGSVPGLVQKVNTLGQGYTDDSSHEKRLELLAQAKALVQALETPQETMLTHLWASGTTLSALATGIKMGLFKHLAKDGGTPKKASDMAAAIDVHADTLTRLLRHITAMGYLIQTGPNEYKPTKFALSLTIPEVCDGYPENLDIVFPAFREMPSYLVNLGDNPPDPVNGIFQRAHNTKMSFFEYIYTIPGIPEQFAHHMAGSRHGQPSWADETFYPVQGSLIAGADASPDAVFLVDVGGSTGHDIAEFHAKHPDVPGKLVLQDLPSVIESIEGSHSKFEAMAYNFFTEQPVKGARAYYMHSVLHDWPDDKCCEILSRVKEAMKPGYSKLLINEHVILSTGASWRVTALDMTLLALTGTKERAEPDWRELIEGVGLKVCKIWTPVDGIESLIECELP